MGIMKKALITGITDQDGSFLAELLLEKGYRVFGFARQESWYRQNNPSHLADRIDILFGDMAEGGDIVSAIQEAKPDEIYNLVSQSHPAESWARAPETLLVNGLRTISLFEAYGTIAPLAGYITPPLLKCSVKSPSPQNEQTPFNPVNPYAAAKVYAHQMAKIYRDSYRLNISTRILFNHESERRPLHFLTQKVAYGVACSAFGIFNPPTSTNWGALLSSMASWPWATSRLRVTGVMPATL